MSCGGRYDSIFSHVFVDGNYDVFDKSSLCGGQLEKEGQGGCDLCLASGAVEQMQCK
jgi:hypothetical protein